MTRLDVEHSSTSADDGGGGIDEVNQKHALPMEPLQPATSPLRPAVPPLQPSMPPPQFAVPPLLTDAERQRGEYQCPKCKDAPLGVKKAKRWFRQPGALIDHA